MHRVEVMTMKQLKKFFFLFLVSPASAVWADDVLELDVLILPPGIRTAQRFNQIKIPKDQEGTIQLPSDGSQILLFPRLNKSWSLSSDEGAKAFISDLPAEITEIKGYKNGLFLLRSSAISGKRYFLRKGSHLFLLSFSHIQGSGQTQAPSVGPALSEFPAPGIAQSPVLKIGIERNIEGRIMFEDRQGILCSGEKHVIQLLGMPAGEAYWSVDYGSLETESPLRLGYSAVYPDGSAIQPGTKIVILVRVFEAGASYSKNFQLPLLIRRAEECNARTAFQP